MEYSRRVAARLMGRIQIRCVEGGPAGYMFVATCPKCNLEKMLTLGERDARTVFCCGRKLFLIPYDKNLGIELPQTLKKSLRKSGSRTYNRVKTWEEFRGRNGF